MASFSVVNNVAAANAQANLVQTNMGLRTALTRLSSGLRINNSGDDAAGLAVANSYRGKVKISKNADHARNFSQCDSLLLGDKCGAHTFPYIEVKNSTAIVEHEATTSKIGEDQIFYCNQRGIDTETAVALIVNGFAKEVMNQLPMEFAVEAQKLLAISLEGSVG